MKLLSSILKRIEAGGEDAIRAQLDEAIGMWAADHGSSHKLVAVSENSVAFADDDSNLFVARYVIEGDLIALSKVRRLLNIQEQANDTDHLDELSAAIVSAVAEERESDADLMVRAALDMKQDAVRIAEMAECGSDHPTARSSFGKKAAGGRFAVAQNAKKNAKKKAFMAAEDIRATNTSKLRKEITEALSKLPGAAVNLLASIDCAAHAPVIEGFAFETVDGIPSLVKRKDSQFRFSTVAAQAVEEKIVETFDAETETAILEAEKAKSKIEVHVYEKPADKEAKHKFQAKPRHTGKGHSVRYKGKSYRLHTGAMGKGKIYLQDRAYLGVANRKNAIEHREADVTNEEDQKWRSKDLGNPLEAKRKPINKGGWQKVTEGEGAKFDVKDCGGGKWQVQKAGDDGVMSIAGDYDTAEAAAKAKGEFEMKERLSMKGEGVILANLAAVREGFDSANDFFYRTGIAWAAFRGEGIGQAAVEVLEKQGEAKELVDACPFLVMCSEDEIYEAIAPHLDAFDPTSIRTYSKQVFEAAQTTEAMAAKVALLDELADNQIKEAILREGVSSKIFDALFLEGDQFDFGSADKLGNDNLDDDQDPSGPEQAAQDDQQSGLGDDNMGGEQGDMGDIDGGFDQQPIQFEMPGDEARELFRKVLDTVGDDIEDDQDFQDLKSKVDDESQELTGDDVVSVLHVIGDYFRAVGKDNEDKDEGAAEKQENDETMDDMDSKGNDQGDAPANDAGDSEAAPGQDKGLGSLDDIGKP